MNEENKMKTALPKLRFHEFVGVWNAKKIEDLIDAQSSQMALGKLNFANSGFPVYGADGIVGFLPTFNQYNDYISIVKDSSGVGRLTLCKKESSILSTLQYLLSKDESKYKLNWLFYLLQNVNFKEYVKGSGIPHIYYSDYKHHNVLVPEPAEQRKIAECLSSVDDLIEAVSDKVEALKEQKKGLMQKLFPTEGKTTPEFRFPEFQNDKPWDADSKFSKYIKLYRGSSPRPIKQYLTTHADGVNWIKIGDTKDVTNYIIESVEEKITRAGSLKSRYVKSGELILANSMSFGKTYLVNIEGCIYDGWFVLREYEDFFYKSFLLQLLNSDYMQAQYKKMSAGGIVQNISSEIVYQTILPHTSKEEQQKIAECLSSIDNLIYAHTTQIEQLKAHKKGLTQQLFPNTNE